MLILAFLFTVALTNSNCYLYRCYLAAGQLNTPEQETTSQWAHQGKCFHVACVFKKKQH